MPLTDKSIWAVSVLVVALLCFLDMSTRLSQQVTNEEKVFKLNDDLNTRQSSFDSTKAAMIMALFDSYDVVEKITASVLPPPTKPVKKGLSAEEQNNQQGKLNKFYVGDYTYTLLGLFKDTERFAVLAQENINSSIVKEIRVTLAHDLMPYKVSKINESVVEFTLVSAQKTVVLSLF
jgi:hypothetical protein